MIGISNIQLILLKKAPESKSWVSPLTSPVRSPALAVLNARFATRKMKNKLIPACSVRLLTRISSTELQRTGSVRSSSAFSNQLLKAEAFLANNRNKSSTLDKRKTVAFISDALLSNVEGKATETTTKQAKRRKKNTQTSSHLLVLILGMLKSFFSSLGVFQQLLPPESVKERKFYLTATTSSNIN